MRDHDAWRELRVRCRYRELPMTTVIEVTETRCSDHGCRRFGLLDRILDSLSRRFGLFGLRLGLFRLCLGLLRAPMFARVRAVLVFTLACSHLGFLRGR